MPLIISFLAPLAFSLFIIYLLCIYMKRLSLLSKLSWIPGPSALPVFGNYFDLIATPPEVAFQNLKDYNKKYNRLYKVWIGTTPLIHCQDEDIIKAAFKMDDGVSRPSMYIMIRGFLGAGLLFGEAGDKWKSMRKSLSESFHTVILDDQLKIFNNKMDSLLNLLEKESQGNKVIELMKFLKPFFLDVSLVSVVGVETKTMSTPESAQYLDGVDRMSDIVMVRLFSPLMKYSAFFNLTGLKKSEETARSNISNYINKYVAERKNTKAFNVDNDRKPKIIADAMLSLEQGNRAVTKVDVFDQVSNNIFAAYDTLSTSVSYLLFLLGNHPDIQEDVMKEINSVSPNILSEGISLKEANNLKLLDRCLKETLRMYPSAALIGRRITKPLVTKRGTIPGGVDLYINMYNYHRNEEIYPDPDKFNPDRFLPENIVKRDPIYWIPFGVGPRSCIGQKQAMVQTKVAAAMILKRFAIKSYEESKDLILSANVMLKSKNGMRVYLSPREH